MTLVVEGETYEDLEHKTNQNLCLINKWLKKNRLILNLDKSHFVVMGRPRSHLNINISIGSKSLSRVNDSKILGVSVDHDLRFESHIQNLRKKVSNRLSFLYRVKHFVPKSTLKSIYNALILSNLDYGNVVWGHTYNIHIQPLILLQRKAAKLITGYENGWKTAFIELDWIPVNLRVNYHSIIFIFKCLNSLSSNYASKLFEFSTSQFSSRISDDKILKLQKPNNNFYQNSIFYKGIKVWNELSIEIRSLNRLTTFINRSYDHFKDF